MKSNFQTLFIIFSTLTLICLMCVSLGCGGCNKDEVNVLDCNVVDNLTKLTLEDKIIWDSEYKAEYGDYRLKFSKAKTGSKFYLFIIATDYDITIDNDLEDLYENILIQRKRIGEKNKKKFLNFLKRGSSSSG